MQRKVFFTSRHTAAPIAAGAALALVLWGCTAEEVDIPALSGPSEQSESLILTANPDLLVADGTSTSIVQAIFRDENGQPIRGRAINFITTDEAGRIAAIGKLSSDFGKANVITDSNGIATVIYTSPVRTDATANQFVLIKARPIGNDANGIQFPGLDPTAFYRSVRIELRSAEPRMFPQVPGNTVPFCGFIIETPNGLRVPAGVLFQTTSNDPDGTIVRYEWRFGDTPGFVEYAPDTAHIFRTPGAWTVRHTVTDDDGGQSFCEARITVTS